MRFLEFDRRFGEILCSDQAEFALKRRKSKAKFHARTADEFRSSESEVRPGREECVQVGSHKFTLLEFGKLKFHFIQKPQFRTVHSPIIDSN